MYTLVPFAFSDRFERKADILYQSFSGSATLDWHQLLFNAPRRLGSFERLEYQ
jgi:hypothetical protein